MVGSTYPLVPSIPELGDSDVETDTESEGTDEDGAHVDTYTSRYSFITVSYAAQVFKKAHCFA